MVLYGEAFRSELVDVLRAALDVEDALALGALEVVVVLHVSALITRRLVRQLHGRQRAVFHHGLEVAIDGGDALTWDTALRALEDLLRVQRALGVQEDRTDGVALFGLSAHRLPVLGF